MEHPSFLITHMGLGAAPGNETIRSVPLPAELFEHWVVLVALVGVTPEPIGVVGEAFDVPCVGVTLDRDSGRVTVCCTWV